MSEDFANIMAAISGDTVEEKIKVFSDVLDKITQFAVNSLDQLTKTVSRIEGLMQSLQQRIVNLESRPIYDPSAAPAPVGIPGVPGVPAPVTPVAPPPPKPEPKPMSPMSARAALQSELKELFNKRKQQ